MPVRVKIPFLVPAPAGNRLLVPVPVIQRLSVSVPLPVHVLGCRLEEPRGMDWSWKPSWES